MMKRKRFVAKSLLNEMLSFTHYKQCVQQINAVIFTGTLGPVSMDKSIFYKIYLLNFTFYTHARMNHMKYTNRMNYRNDFNNNE